MSLDARLKRLMEGQKNFDEPFGRLAELLVRKGYWAQLGFRHFEEYCRERLGMAARTVRQRVWLERQMCAHPEIREALASGELTFSKALLVAKDAGRGPLGGGNVTERIRDAASTTCQQVEQKSTEAEDRRNRAAGVRKLWSPKDAAETVAIAISSVRGLFESRGEWIDSGEALAVMADHFVWVWTLHLKHRRIPNDRREVLMRNGGLCAVPGCSRGAVHEHHIEFQSQGGSDELTNRLGICTVHHLRGIHRGRLEVMGRAGERLIWQIGRIDWESGERRRGSLTPRAQFLETWMTEGNADVRRAGVMEGRIRYGLSDRLSATG